MSRTPATTPLIRLHARRRALGITVEALSKLSGVSVATARRVLRGDYSAASFETVSAMANALGMAIRIEQEIEPSKMKEQQALRKASKLVNMVQATSSLEGQGLDRPSLQERTRELAHKLLGGSRRKLWAEI